MINLVCLKHFLTVTRCQSLAAASEQLHLTPSALSKSLKRLEQSLHTPLFDREGRTLKLNAEGRSLEKRAAALLHTAEQLQAEFAGERHAFKCRIAGPNLLHLGWGQKLSDKLLSAYPKASIIFEDKDDHSTIASVASGEHDFGIISIPDGGISDNSLTIIPIGETEFRVCISPRHPLQSKKLPTSVDVTALITHDFVAPITPPFSNIAHLAATDGWRDDIFKRKLAYRTDDVLMMRQLIVSGKALAYLPDYVIEMLGLQILKVAECPYFCRQKIALIHRRSEDSGWISFVSAQFKSRPETH